MKYQIRHTTRYVGSAPISVGHNQAWLTPRTSPTQQCLAHQIRIEPEPTVRSTRSDYFGNTVTQFAFNQGYQSLTVTAESQVEVAEPKPGMDPITRLAEPGPPWESVVAALSQHATSDNLAAYEFVFDSPRCRSRDEFAEYARQSFAAGRPIAAAAFDLMQRIHNDFRYDSMATSVTTPVEQVFRQRRGVCQDFAHLMISMLRSLGLAARYVSGYLRTSRRPGQAELIGHDASHAWVGVFCESLGWIDFDPTNRLVPTTDHITVAWGRDYSDVTPLKGVYIGGGTLQLSVAVEMCEG